MKDRGVVLDLDDTLCDTMGELVMPAHAEAAKAMQAAGLCHTVERIFAARMSALRQDPRADVDAFVSALLGGGGREAAAGRRAYLEREVSSLTLLPGAARALERLRGSPLALVTRGAPKTQQQKLDLLGIEDLFDIVEIVPAGQTKDAAFGRVLAAWGLPGRVVVAVGDRPDADVAAAHRVGMPAVRILRGEHAEMEPYGPEETAEATVATVAEVPQAVAELWAKAGLPKGR
ncbi:HAD family hydrolase [bacterium]|nr:HAD family hydrolase [bacterium]